MKKTQNVDLDKTTINTLFDTLKFCIKNSTDEYMYLHKSEIEVQKIAYDFLMAKYKIDPRNSYFYGGKVAEIIFNLQTSGYVLCNNEDLVSELLQIF